MITDLIIINSFKFIITSPLGYAPGHLGQIGDQERRGGQKGDVHEKFSYQYKYSPNSKIYTNGPNGLKFGMLGAFGC